jgi:Trp operon repressor
METGWGIFNRNSEEFSAGIDMWAEIRDVGTLQNPIAELVGGEMPPHQIKTESGQHVNRITKGEYEIVETGKILTSADPNAA